MNINGDNFFSWSTNIAEEEIQIQSHKKKIKPINNLISKLTKNSIIEGRKKYLKKKKKVKPSSGEEINATFICWGSSL